MVDVLGFETGVSLPGAISSPQGSTITIILAVVFFILAGGIILYLILSNKKFNKKIVLFENISGNGFQVVGKDRARIIKVGNGGEEILYLRKSKTYRSAYGRKMGKNTYWFARGQDGYWYNFLLGDLDAKMGMLDIEPIDRDMRYMHVAVRKNITENYRKLKFMEKYGGVVINGIFLIIMVIAVWLLLDNIGEMMETANKAMGIATEALESSNNVLSKVDTTCSGGTGLTIG